MDIGRLMVTLGVNTIELERATQKMKAFQTAAEKTQARMRKFGGQMKATGRMLTTYVTLPMAAAGAAAIKMHMDFEASMAKVVGLVGVARKTVQGWAEDTKALAVSVGRSPKELADALYFITSAGIRGAESMEVLEASAKAAAAGMGETKLIADLVTSAMNAYGKEVLSAAKATDILAETVKEGKSEATLLATTMGMVLPIAAELGVTFSQVGAAGAAMTRTGTVSATAFMQLRQILNSLLDPAQMAEQAMVAMGTSSQALRKTIREEGLLAALMQIRTLTNKYGEDIMGKVFPNIRALSGTLDILGKNLTDNIKIFDNLENATGRNEKAFAAAAETTKFKFAQAVTAAQLVLLELGESMKKRIVPVFESFTKTLENLVGWYKSLDEQSQLFIHRWGFFLTVIGPVVTILGFLVANVLPSLIGLFVGLASALKIAGVALAGIATTAGVSLSALMPVFAIVMAISWVLVPFINRLIKAGDASRAAAKKQKELYKELRRTRLEANKIDFEGLFSKLGLMTKVEIPLTLTKVGNENAEVVRQDLIKKLQIDPDELFEKTSVGHIPFVEIMMKPDTIGTLQDTLRDVISIEEIINFETKFQQIEVPVKFVSSGFDMAAADMTEREQSAFGGEKKSEGGKTLPSFAFETPDISKLKDIGKLIADKSIADLKGLKKEITNIITDTAERLKILEDFEGTGLEKFIKSVEASKLTEVLMMAESILVDINTELDDMSKAAARFKEGWEGDIAEGANLLDIAGSVRQWRSDMEIIDHSVRENIYGFDEASERADAFGTVLDGILQAGGGKMKAGELAAYINQATDLGLVDLSFFNAGLEKWLKLSEDADLSDVTQAIKDFNDEMSYLKTKAKLEVDFDVKPDQISALEDVIESLQRASSKGIISKEAAESLEGFIASLERLSKPVNEVNDVMGDMYAELDKVDGLVNKFGNSIDVNTRKIAIYKATLDALKAIGFDEQSKEVQQVKEEWEAYGGAIQAAFAVIQGFVSDGSFSKMFEGTEDLEKFTTLLEEMGVSFDVSIGKTDIFISALESMKKKFPEMAEAIQVLIDMFEELNKKPPEIEVTFLEAFEQILQVMGTFTNAMASLIESQKQRELSAVGQSIKKREAIEKKYFEKQKKWAIVQAIIGTALAIVNALQTQPFILGLAMAVIAAAAGAVQIAAIAGQSFAEGGVVYGETYARIGEYTNARSNPEIVAPLDRLVSILKTELFGGMATSFGQDELNGIGSRVYAGFNRGQKKEQKVVFEIEQDKLVGILENYSNEYNNL